MLKLNYLWNVDDVVAYALALVEIYLLSKDKLLIL